MVAVYIIHNSTQFTSTTMSPPICVPKLASTKELHLHKYRKIVSSLITNPKISIDNPILAHGYFVTHKIKFQESLTRLQVKEEACEALSIINIQH